MASVTARWVNRLTGVLLLCASCAVIVAAAPPVLRAVAADRPVQRAAKLPPLTGRDPPPRPPARYGGVDPDERVSPHLAPVDPHRAPDDSGADESEDRMRMGLARRDLKVLGDPSLAGATLGEIKAGSMVMIVKEAGDAALVIHSGTEGVVMGWVRRSEIAIR